LQIFTFYTSAEFYIFFIAWKKLVSWVEEIKKSLNRCEAQSGAVALPIFQWLLLFAFGRSTLRALS
jgi:hypothetical protein